MPWSEYLCPTQNWYVENLMFGVMLLVGITLMNGISTWQRGSRRISNTWQSGSRKISSPSCHEDTVRRYRLRTTKRTLTRRFTGHPDRGLPSIQNCDLYMCVVCKPPGLWYWVSQTVHSSFSVRCDGKTQINFLANPVFLGLSPVCVEEGTRGPIKGPGKSWSQTRAFPYLDHRAHLGKLNTY